MLKLKQYLEKHKITHAAFAERVGVSQATVNRYVSGDRSPSKRTILRIKEATKGFVKERDWFVQMDRAA